VGAGVKLSWRTIVLLKDADADLSDLKIYSNGGATLILGFWG
jgi:hypothetical protein